MIEPNEVPLDPMAEYPSFTNLGDVRDKIYSREPFLPAFMRHRAVKLGIPTLDEKIYSGPTSVGVVAAETGFGKSSLISQAMWESAKAGYKPALISLEMINEEVQARIVSHASGINYTHILEHGCGDRYPMTRGQEELLDEMFYMCPMSGMPFEALECRVVEAVNNFEIKSLWVDYFTLMQPADLKSKASMAHMYAELSKSFKRLAQKTRLAIVLIAQFNRSFKPGEKPSLFMLKETSQLEQDCSWGLILWSDEDGNSWAHIDKNRGGPKGNCQIRMDLGIQRIHEVSQSEALLQKIGADPPKF